MLEISHNVPVNNDCNSNKDLKEKLGHGIFGLKNQNGF
jgi:hypothetical protein